MSEDHVYKDGDIVWVKLGNNWWPGEVTGIHRQPEGLVKNLKKKPYCVVKFFQEDAYEYIKSSKQIFPFQCSKKDEFIKKGTALYNAKNKFMEKFPSDVETAERLTRKTVQTTDLIIINDRPDSIVKAILGPTYTRRSNDYYDNNTCNTDYNNKRRSGDSVTKILNITPQRTTLETTIRTPDAAKTLPSPIKTPSNRTHATTPDINFYRCNLCNFSSQRQNVMILHRRTHNNATGGNAATGVATFGPTVATSKSAPAAIIAASTPKATTTTAATTTKNGSNKSATITIDKNNTARVTKLDKQNVAYLNSRSKSGLRSGAVATHAADAATVGMIHHKLRSSLRIDADVKEITLPDRVPAAAITKDGLNMSVDYDTTDNSTASAISEVNMQTGMQCSPRKHNLESADDTADGTAQAKSTAEEIRQRLLADWSDFEKDDEMTEPGVEHEAKSQTDAVRRLSIAQVNTAKKQQDNITYDNSTPSNTAMSNNGAHTSTQNRIRNIPKKDRRDAVIKEFISDYVPTTPNAATHIDNSVNHNSSSSSVDSVVVVAVVPPNIGETINLDDIANDEVLAVGAVLGVNGDSGEVKPEIAGDAREIIIKTDIFDNHKVEVDIEVELQRAMQLEDGIETKLEPDIDTYTPKLKFNRGRRNVEGRTSNELKSNYVSNCQLESDGDQNDSNVENKPHILPVVEEIKTEEVIEQTHLKGRQKRQQRSSRRQRNARDLVKNASPEALTTKAENEPIVVSPLEAPQVLPISPQHIKEERPQTSAAVTVPLSQQHLLTDCFDFQEDDSCNDTLKSIADFKKKYLSPDKVQERAAQANNGILQEQEPESGRKRSSEQTDQQLAHDIEMLLEQTADTIPAVVSRTHSYGGSSKEDLPVKGLPIKERGKRIFKSRNRARITTDDTSSSITYTATGSENVAALESKGEENAARVSDANVHRENQQQQVVEERVHVVINSGEHIERDVEDAQEEHQLSQSVEGMDNQVVASGGNEVGNASETNRGSVELPSPKIVNNGLLATPSLVSIASSGASDEQNERQNCELIDGALAVPQSEQSFENNLESTLRAVEVVQQSKENELESIMQVDESIGEESYCGNEFRAQVVDVADIQINAKDSEGEADDIEKDPKDFQRRTEYTEKEPEDMEEQPEDIYTETKDVEIEPGMQQKGEPEFRAQEDVSYRADFERELAKEPEDNERDLQDIERQQGDVGIGQEYFEGEPENIVRDPEGAEKEAEDTASEHGGIQREPRHIEREPEDIEIQPGDIESEPENVEREPEDMERAPKDIDEEPEDIERETEDMVREPQGIENELDDTDRESEGLRRAPESQEEIGEEIASMQADEVDTRIKALEEQKEEEAVNSEIEKINKIHCTLIADVENGSEASMHESPAHLPVELAQKPKEALAADPTLNNEDISDEQHELPPSRITSPTDDNSSVCISEAGAEFGSPTSMLDDERLPAMTGRLMTPTEGLVEPIAAGEEHGKETIAEQSGEGVEHTNGEQNYVPQSLEEERVMEVSIGDVTEESIAEEPMESVDENEKDIYAEQTKEGLVRNENNAEHMQEVKGMEVRDNDDTVGTIAEQPVEDESVKEGNYVQNLTIEEQPTEMVGGLQDKIAEQLVETEDNQGEEANLEQPLEHIYENEREEVVEEPLEGEAEVEREKISEDVVGNDEGIENAEERAIEKVCIYAEDEPVSEMKAEEDATCEVALVRDQALGELSEERNENFHQDSENPVMSDLENSIRENEQFPCAEADAEETEVRYQTEKEMRNQDEIINEDVDIQKQDEILHEETEISNQGETLDEETEMRNQIESLSKQAEMLIRAEEEEIRSDEMRAVETEMPEEDEMFGEEAEILNQAEIVDEEAETLRKAKIFKEKVEMKYEEKRLSEEKQPQNQFQIVGHETEMHDEAEVLNETPSEEMVEPKITEHETAKSEIEGESENNFVKEHTENVESVQNEQAVEDVARLNNGEEQEAAEAANTGLEKEELLCNEENNSAHIGHTEPEDTASDDDFIESPPHEPLSGHEGDALTTVTRTQKRRTIAERNKTSETLDNETEKSTTVPDGPGNCTPTFAESESSRDLEEANKEGRRRRRTERQQDSHEATEEESEEKQIKQPQKTPPRINPRKSTKPKKSTENLNEVEVSTAYVLSAEQLVANVGELTTAQAMHESAKTTHVVATPTGHLIDTSPQHLDQPAGALFEETEATPIKTGSSRKRRGAIKITPRRNASAIQMTIESRKRISSIERDEIEQKAKSRKIYESNIADSSIVETAPAANEATNTSTNSAHSVQDHSSSTFHETEAQLQVTVEHTENQHEQNSNTSIQPQLKLQNNTEKNLLTIDNGHIVVEQACQQNESMSMQPKPIQAAAYNGDETTPAATETATVEGNAGEEETVNTEVHCFNTHDEANAEDLVAYSPIENQQSVEGVVHPEELLVDAGNITEAAANNESNITSQEIGVTLYPQFDSSQDPQFKADAPAINVSPMEKVRINVDVANPLSTQIANILGTKSVAGAASTNVKRKSNLEESIPTFIIERPGEQDAVAHVQQMCPNVEITRKEKLIEVPTDAGVGQQSEVVANNSNAMFDISNMPIVLGNEHFMSAQGDMQIVLTSSTETDQQLRTDGQQILQQQIFQSPYRSPQQPNVQQRQRKRSTNQQPQQLTPQQQQQPGLIIIKAAPGDLIIQQTQPQSQAIVSGTVQQMPQTATDANAKYNLGSGVTLLPIAEPKQKQQQRQQQEKLQQQQQQAAAKKPKSLAAAATGGRKQIGNTITLPSTITVKQRQRKLSDGLASATTATTTLSVPMPSEQQPSSSKSTNIDSKVQKRIHSTNSRRTQMQAQAQKIQQRRLTATYTNLMELQQQEQRRSEARAQLQRRLSYSEVYTPPPAKIFRNTFMAGPIFDIHSQQIFAATAEQQLLQLQQQQLQQQQQQRQMVQSTSTSTSQPPPLHPLPNRKSRHTLRRLSAKPEVIPPSAQNEIQEEQQQLQDQQPQQLQPTQFVLLSQPQHLTLVEPQHHQEQQVAEVHIPTELAAPPLPSEIIPAEYEAIELQEQVPQVYTEEILAEAFEANELPPSSVMAVPSQPVPGYPDTLLLCRRVDDEWLPVVAQPYYFTHSDQQLRPIPKEVLIGLPILTPNADKTTETSANDSYKGETGVTILIGNEYVHMEWDQFLEVMRSNDDLFDLRDDQGRVFQLNRDALLTLQNDADLQDKYRQLQQLLEEQQMEEQQQLEHQQLLQQHLMQQLQTVTVAAEDGMGADVIPFLQIDTSQTLQLIGTEDGSLILQPTLAQPPLSPPCTRPALTNATNALLNQTPIMSPLEKPSTAAAAAAATLISDSAGQHLNLTTAVVPEHLTAAGFIATDVTNTLAVTRPTLGDSLAVIGVVPTQPTLLPTTITNPAIAPPKTDLIPDMTTAAQMHAQYRHAQRAIYNDPGS